MWVSGNIPMLPNILHGPGQSPKKELIKMSVMPKSRNLVLDDESYRGKTKKDEKGNPRGRASEGEGWFREECSRDMNI